MKFNTIKIILAIILFICVLDMPYGYYQFVRISATLGFAYLAYSANKQNIDNEVIPFIVLVMIFQPFAIVHLSKITWNIIDVLVGLGLVATLKQQQKV
jgi:hypothetical protein